MEVSEREDSVDMCLAIQKNKRRKQTSRQNRRRYHLRKRTWHSQRGNEEKFYDSIWEK